MLITGAIIRLRIIIQLNNIRASALIKGENKMELKMYITMDLENEMESSDVSFDELKDYIVGHIEDFLNEHNIKIIDMEIK